MTIEISILDVIIRIATGICLFASIILQLLEIRENEKFKKRDYLLPYLDKENKE